MKLPGGSLRLSQLFGVMVVVVLAFGMTPGALGQTTWYVDDDAVNDPGPGDSSVSDPLADGSVGHPFDSIQRAIDASSSGDVVEIADGTYWGYRNRDLDFRGKAITVRSASGDPSRCIVDCKEVGRGFYFHRGEGRDSIVDGLTITGGLTYYWSDGGEYGGGVYIEYGRPTMRNCRIVKNSSAYGGGGVYVANSSAKIVGCRIEGNTSMDGGGIYTVGNNAIEFRECTIRGNESSSDGGGIYGVSDDISVAECVICDNTSRFGGGMVVDDGTATVVNCRFDNNLGMMGGGIYLIESTLEMTGCRLLRNFGYSGGAIYCTGSIPTINNCVIDQNFALQGSSAYFGNGSDGVVTNCTIRANTVLYQYGDIHCNSSSPTVSNCIVWGGTMPKFSIASGEPSVTFCDVQGGWPGTGNIDADPLFALSDNARLMPGSPCIDTGTNSPTGGLPATDGDGNVRSMDGDGNGVAQVDMGAYEAVAGEATISIGPSSFDFFSVEGGDDPRPETLLLRNSGAGSLAWEISGDQPDWLSLSPTSGSLVEGEVAVMLGLTTGGLNEGVYTAELGVFSDDAANSPQKVVITLYVGRTIPVPGEYGTIQEAIDAADTGDHVVIADGVYTGTGNKDLDFGGKTITVRSVSGNARDCVIDCEGDGRGFSFVSREGRDAKIEGVTIKNGYIPDDVAAGAGGAIFCSVRAQPTVVDCVLKDCRATLGGAVTCYLGSRLLLSNCMINGNKADSSGGGVYCSYSSPTLDSCAISGNLASIGGGGVCSLFSDRLEIFGCAIVGNFSDTGGGVASMDCEELTISNCLLAANSSGFGAAIACASGEPPHPSSVTIKNSVLWDLNDEIWNNDGSSLLLSYCDVRGGAGQDWFGATNTDVDPMFVDADGADDDPATWEDNDYRLAAGSPCIDAGSNGAVSLDVADFDGDGDVTERVPYDLDGMPRFVDDPATVDSGVAEPPLYPAVVDIGAYEYHGVLLPGDFDADGDVDLDDYAAWERCMMGPEDVAGFGCGAMDLDADGDVDLVDFAALQRLY